MENELEARVVDIEKRLDGMMITDRKFWKRALAVFGYQSFVALVFYAAMFVVLIFAAGIEAL